MSDEEKRQRAAMIIGDYLSEIGWVLLEPRPFINCVHFEDGRWWIEGAAFEAGRGILGRGYNQKELDQRLTVAGLL